MQRTISKITFDKKTKSAVILFDSNESLSIAIDLVGKFNLRVGLVIEQTLLDKILFEQEMIEAKRTALNFLSYRPRTTKEVEIKLISSKFSREAIQKALEFLYEYGYLDDEKFAFKYAMDKVRLKNEGFRKIEQELLRKGIKKDVVGKVLKQLQQIDIEKGSAKKVAQRKYCSVRFRTETERKQKTINYLLQRGFSFEIAKEVVDEISGSDNFAHPEGLEPPTL